PGEKRETRNSLFVILSEGWSRACPERAAARGESNGPLGLRGTAHQKFVIRSGGRPSAREGGRSRGTLRLPFFHPDEKQSFVIPSEGGAGLQACIENCIENPSLLPQARAQRSEAPNPLAGKRDDH